MFGEESESERNLEVGKVYYLDNRDNVGTFIRREGDTIYFKVDEEKTGYGANKNGLAPFSIKGWIYREVKKD